MPSDPPRPASRNQTLRASLEDASKVRPVEIHHVNFKTRRIAEMRDWYTMLLNAEVLFDSPLATFLTYDGAHHRIALLGSPDFTPRDPAAEGFEHVAFLYHSLHDLLSTWQRLKDAGHEPFWTTNHGPSISFYYRDPDANTNELQVDWFPDIAKLAEWFATGDFAANPIGVDLDPHKLSQVLHSGMDHDEIFRRSRAGELA
jgi:catechol-2,3-dioxygenase